MGVGTFRKNLLIKNSIYGAENDIFLCITYKTITIILISDEYNHLEYGASLLA